MDKTSRERLLKLIRDAAGPAVKEIVEDRLQAAKEGNGAKAGDAGAAPFHTPRGIDVPASRPGTVNVLNVPYEQLFHTGPRAGELRNAPPMGPQGLRMAEVLLACALGGGDPERASKLVRSEWGRKDDDPLVKQLASSSATAGGFMIGQNLSDEFIDLLAPRVVVRALGADVVDMTGGHVDIAGFATGVAGGWVGENQGRNAEEQTYRMVRLTSKQLQVSVPISKSLVRRGGPRVTAQVRRDMLRGLGVTEDGAFIRAVGSNFRPTGLRNLVAAANLVPATDSANDLAEITSDLGSLVLTLEESNVALETPGWIWAPRTRQRLMTIRDGNGNYAFREELLRGMFWGAPFGTTTQVPVNLGGGDESEVYFFDFMEVLLGQEMQFEVAVSNEATYLDANGQLVSAFANYQTIIQVNEFVDLGMRHDLGGAVMTGVTWAP